jgi:hypothetical protein
MSSLINKRMFKTYLLSLSKVNADKRNEARREMGIHANLKPHSRVSKETYDNATAHLINWMKAHIIEKKKGKTL